MPTSAKVLTEELNSKAYVVSIIGQLDQSTVEDAVVEIYEIVEKIPKNGTLILNLSKLEYMNSKSIGYISDFYNKLTAKNARLLIAEAPEQIQDILNVVGLTQIIEFLPSLNEAKKLAGD